MEKNIFFLFAIEFRKCVLEKRDIMNLESPVSDSSGLEGALLPYLDDEVHEQTTDGMYGIVHFFRMLHPISIL